MNGTDKILREKKDHGETLALKGLMLSRLDRKSEAYDCARFGVQNDDKSIFCLIILGLICQSDFDYEKAIEYVQNALKISHVPVNIELPRYLSFVDCRCRIVTLEHNICFHHIAHAVSHHVNNCSKAVEILENIEKSEGDVYEEVLLYKVDKVTFKEQHISLLVNLDKLDEAKKLYLKLLSQNPENYRLSF
ncbi:hypothetical protein POM88_008184 [Heracleum sosnowskyi]|uniref:Uncharacterized protein n=1 Tax=Heracleum sosnowskyi TaxID=360622 RepID=A0AAD8J8Y9_9APIA|nr:hypothetical protein POM88_008184 [Heracleum sosnowskyi]